MAVELGSFTIWLLLTPSLQVNPYIVQSCLLHLCRNPFEDQNGPTLNPENAATQLGLSETECGYNRKYTILNPLTMVIIFLSCTACMEIGKNPLVSLYSNYQKKLLCFQVQFPCRHDVISVGIIT